MFLIGALLTPFFGYAIIFLECSRTKGYTTTGVASLRAFFCAFLFLQIPLEVISISNVFVRAEIFEMDYM